MAPAVLIARLFIHQDDTIELIEWIARPHSRQKSLNPFGSAPGRRSPCSFISRLRLLTQPYLDRWRFLPSVPFGLIPFGEQTINLGSPADPLP
jgi:hypothetical protein